MESKKYSPMIQHYLATKEKNPDCLLFYRLGDFYEMFFDDARIASQQLDLVLTAKAAGSNEKVPMCGIPYHASNTYIQRLIKKGFKVAVCEQLSDPAASKGLVERDIVKIITPGTYMEEGLDAKSYNYLAAVLPGKWDISILFCELSTGDLKFRKADKNPLSLYKALMEKEVSEIVIPGTIDKKLLGLFSDTNLLISKAKPVQLKEEQKKLIPSAAGYVQNTLELLMGYLNETQKQSIDHLLPVEILSEHNHLVMDYETRAHLELTQTSSGAARSQTLFSCMDRTETAAGSRLLKNWIETPLCTLSEIMKRQNTVKQLKEDFILRSQLQEHLENVYDLERLISRISYGNARGQDILQLVSSLKEAAVLVPMMASLVYYPELADVNDCSGLLSSIEGAIVENPPASTKDGGLFQEGYNQQLDHLRTLSEDGKQYILDLEARERERTGIKALKIGYNRVFGYYIEVRNGSLPQIKDEYGYTLKQNMANAARFSTVELKSREEEILLANEQKIALEQELWKDLLAAIKEWTFPLHALARNLAILDVLVSMAVLAGEGGYTAPVFNEEGTIDIKEGRHPVLEKRMDHFISNDWSMPAEQNIQLITGPNMGGKSTFMRQNALIAVMAQMGSFVPAKSAGLPIFDRIFTRIGASDDLLLGQSTFMVEMLEANQALQYATKNSLILFDEIGRGTATFDGLALAQAMTEYIDTAIQAKTLFSTHYHELTHLEKEHSSICNVHVDVKERNKEIQFLYRVVPGKADKSYGIHVARLAGLPKVVLDRAQSLLSGLEQTNPVSEFQPSLFIMDAPTPEKSKLLAKLSDLDVDALSPREALSCLYELKALSSLIEK